jgi:hypothetical protein
MNPKEITSGPQIHSSEVDPREKLFLKRTLSPSSPTSMTCYMLKDDTKRVLNGRRFGEVVHFMYVFVPFCVRLRIHEKHVCLVS